VKQLIKLTLKPKKRPKNANKQNKLQAKKKQNKLQTKKKQNKLQAKKTSETRVNKDERNEGKREGETF